VKKKFALVLIACALISFTKFNHCRTNDFVAPDNYVHACYTDIPALFGERDLINHTWPYLSATNAMEYPPVIGLGNWLISFITPSEDSYRWFFDLNVLLLITCFIGIAYLLRKMRPQYMYLFPLAPAVLASLFINWDLWAVITALLAIYYFEQKRYEASAIALAVSISTKFFPVVLLLPTAIIFWRNRQFKELQRYIFTTALFWLAINLPIIATSFGGWWRFFKLNLERSADFGSIWFALNILGVNTPGLNDFYSLITIAAFALLVYFLIKLDKTPKLSEIAFFVVVIFTTTSKVYSPQYVLWLTPLAVIALRNKKQLSAFWIWQVTEMIYHLAIWQYLALDQGAEYGLPAGGYAIAILLRIAGTGWFTYKLASDFHRSPASISR
jgi:uncharacterized membrane protein